jgi:hypothetical protein
MKCKIIIVMLVILTVVGLFSYHYRRALKRKLIQVKDVLVQVIWEKRSYEMEQKCSCTSRSLRLRRDVYKQVHIPKLQKMKHLTFIDKEHTKNKLISANKLVKIEPKLYKIKDLRHSSSYLTPKGKEILDELALRYKMQLKGTKSENSQFRISSLTRTHEQQKQLSALNKAATMHQSAHSYGQAFDIDYLHTRDCHESLLALEKVLTLMQTEGKILLCPEKDCIHVTVL